MDLRPLAGDDRAFSETFAVGVLVAITFAMTLTVGVYVLAVDTGDGGATAEFSYDYDGDADTLLVRYEQGQNYSADAIRLESGEYRATWAQLARMDANATLRPGAAIQLSRSGQWGRPVTDATELRILHVRGENATQLSNWTA